MKPAISVIIPTFNRADKITASIASILGQNCEDWELVIVDDGSMDNTQDVIEGIKKQNPERRILYVIQENGGPAAARNKGVENCHADIVTYLDSDDRFYPSALEDILWVLKDEKALYGLPNHNRTICLVDALGREVSRKFDPIALNKSLTLEQLYDWEVKTTSSGIFHRRYLYEEGICWQSSLLMEDLELLLQLARKNAEGFRHIPKALVDYMPTYGADGICSNAGYLDWADNFARIYHLHKDDPLMRNPHVYLDRVEKYRRLQEAFLRGEVLPPQYKYFPELVAAKEKGPGKPVKREGEKKPDRKAKKAAAKKA